MFVISYSSRFLKDLKKCTKRGLDLQKLKNIIKDLENDIPLDSRYKAHRLQGEYKGYTECHIEPDWLLIYLIDRNGGKIYTVRTGTHNDLF